MFRLSYFIPVLLVLSLPVLAAAQPKRVVYGPVVRAYLTGLDEELNELEFQLRHQEISRPDYDRAKLRLAILRRAVQEYAKLRQEDRVPELQIVNENELASLGLGQELNADALRVGQQYGGRWELFSIERGRPRVFVFEHLRAETVPERKLGAGVDPRSVIETIVIQDAPPPAPEVAPSSSASAPTPQVSAGEEPKQTAAPRLRFEAPRILHIYLPEYTDKARAKQIEGEIAVRALLQRNGKIKNVKVEKGLGFGLDDRAAEAVKRLGFLPAQLDGQDVDAQTQIVFNFKLAKVTVFVNVLNAEALVKGERQ